VPSLKLTLSSWTQEQALHASRKAPTTKHCLTQSTYEEQEPA